MQQEVFKSFNVHTVNGCEIHLKFRISNLATYIVISKKVFKIIFSEGFFNLLKIS